MSALLATATETVPGQFFDGHQSMPHAAQLRRGIDGDVLILADSDGTPLARAELDAVQVSARLGDLPRHVDFPDGGRFETADHAGIERLFAGRGRFVHWLESRYRYVLLSIAVLVAFSAWVVMYGIPSFSTWLAYQLPADTYQQVGRYTLEYLDKGVFKPTELSAARQAELQARFAPYLAEYARQGVHLKVHFRHMGSANAMALPSGDLVFTDAIVKLAQDDDELVAVLAHEIGHVAHRHAVRRSLQTGILGVMVAMFTGDATGLSELLTGVPLVLTQLGYSRDMEREADDFALAMMQRHGIPRHRFVDLMSRLRDESDCNPKEADCKAAAWTQYFSTHPGMGERLQHFSDSAVLQTH